MQNACGIVAVLTTKVKVKKQAKIEIGNHFGLSGVYSLFLIEALLIHLTGTCRIDHIAGV